MPLEGGMADDDLKSQAEITHLNAESKKFKKEEEEIEWRMRPIWSYGKWAVAAVVAGVTGIGGG